MYDKVIGVDMDGVLAYSLGAFIKQVRRKYNIDMNATQVTQWGLENCIPNLTSDIVKDIFTDPETFEISYPIVRAVECLKYLKDLDWSIFIITDRPMNCWDATHKWLERYKVPFDGLYLAKAVDKPQLTQDLLINVFVEDRRETTIDLSRVCPTVYLLDRTYNQGVIPINVYRVKDWSEIVTELCFPKVVGNG